MDDIIADLNVVDKEEKSIEKIASYMMHRLRFSEIMELKKQPITKMRANVRLALSTLYWWI